MDNLPFRISGCEVVLGCDARFLPVLFRVTVPFILPCAAIRGSAPVCLIQAIARFEADDAGSGLPADE